MCSSSKLSKRASSILKPLFASAALLSTPVSEIAGSYLRAYSLWKLTPPGGDIIPNDSTIFLDYSYRNDLDSLLATLEHLAKVAKRCEESLQSEICDLERRSWTRLQATIEMRFKKKEPPYNKLFRNTRARRQVALH